MKPAHSFFPFLAAAALTFALPACGISTLGSGTDTGGTGGTGGDGGSGATTGNGGNGGSGGQPICEGPNPRGCFQGKNCAANEVCALEGCAPTGCDCDAENGWLCTLDCNGGICLPDSYCRDSTMCPPAEGCVGPDDVVCGIPPQQECGADGDCGNGDVCHSSFDGCSPDHVGSRCGPPCAQDTDCGDASFVCGPGGSCAPRACNAGGGSTCPASQLCDPTTIDVAAAPPDRTNGCSHIPCANDDPCPGGSVCVNAYCQQGFGTCMPPVP